MLGALLAVAAPGNTFHTGIHISACDVRRMTAPIDAFPVSLASTATLESGEIVICGFGACCRCSKSTSQRRRRRRRRRQRPAGNAQSNRSRPYYSHYVLLFACLVACQPACLLARSLARFECAPFLRLSVCLFVRRIVRSLVRSIVRRRTVRACSLEGTNGHDTLSLLISYMLARSLGSARARTRAEIVTLVSFRICQ